MALALVLALGCKKTESPGGSAKGTAGETGKTAPATAPKDDGPPVQVFAKQVEETVATRTASAFNRPAVAKAFDDAPGSPAAHPGPAKQRGSGGRGASSKTLPTWPRSSMVRVANGLTAAAAPTSMMKASSSGSMPTR